MSEKRIAVRGAPNHRVGEAELQQMRIQIADLTKAVNDLTAIVSRYETSRIEEKALEAHYMGQVLGSINVEKGVCTFDEIGQRATELQEKALGLVDKPNGIVEMGDAVSIKFKLLHGGELVDDQTAAPLLYEMGSNALSCERGMIGMRVGEERVLDVVFGQGFTFKHLIGATLQIEIKCVGIKVGKQVGHV
jgi:hypothetical protein